MDYWDLRVVLVTDRGIPVRPGISRTFRILAAQTLEELHRSIDRVLQQDVDPDYEFMIGTGARARRYFPSKLLRDPELRFAESDRDAGATSIGSLGLRKGGTLSYTSGIDLWAPEHEMSSFHRLRVVDVGPRAPEDSYPKVIRSRGELPYRKPPDWGGAEQEEMRE